MKQTVRRIAWILALVLFAASLCACGGSEAPEWKPEEPTTRKEEPTTEALTTKAPETEAPTTKAPETEAPTTEAPTTAAPTTEAPTTEAPGASEYEVPEGLKEYTYKWLAVVIPTDFKETVVSGIKTLVPSSYPIPSDNINFTEAKGSADEVTESALKYMFETAYKNAYGVNISNFSYKRTVIPGGDLIISGFTFSYNGIDFIQTGYMVFHEGEVITVTYTDTSRTYSEAFETSMRSIRIAE